MDTSPRPLMRSASRGMRNRCPSCDQRKLFSRSLKVVDQCDNCGEEFHHHRADDMPAYLNIFVVGHIVVAATMILMDLEIMGMWTLIALASFSALFISGLLMRPLKGMVVGAQWALRMHGFGGHDD